MSDTLTVTGQLAIAPDAATDAALSGDPGIKVPFTESLTLSRKHSVTVDLPDTTPVAVNVANIVNVHALVIKASAAITVTITSASGSAQVIPCYGLLVLITQTVAITAITLTAAATATVQVTMGRV